MKTFSVFAALLTAACLTLSACEKHHDEHATDAQPAATTPAAGHDDASLDNSATPQSVERSTNDVEDGQSQHTSEQEGHSNQ